MTAWPGSKKGQAPPPWVVFEALTADDRPWFDVQPGERRPTVLEQERPSLVVWSSIWDDRPELVIRFDIEADGAGSMVAWTLLDEADALDDDGFRPRRYRLNELVNGRLRETFG